MSMWPNNVSTATKSSFDTQNKKSITLVPAPAQRLVHCDGTYYAKATASLGGASRSKDDFVPQKASFQSHCNSNQQWGDQLHWTRSQLKFIRKREKEFASILAITAEFFRIFKIHRSPEQIHHRLIRLAEKRLEHRIEPEAGTDTTITPTEPLTPPPSVPPKIVVATADSGMDHYPPPAQAMLSPSPLPKLKLAVRDIDVSPQLFTLRHDKLIYDLRKEYHTWKYIGDQLESQFDIRPSYYQLSQRYNVIRGRTIKFKLAPSPAPSPIAKNIEVSAKSRISQSFLNISALLQP